MAILFTQEYVIENFNRKWKECIISIDYSLKLTSTVLTRTFQYPFILVCINSHALHFEEVCNRVVGI